ncbi:unnamed protein product [Lota lota]
MERLLHGVLNAARPSLHTASREPVSGVCHWAPWSAADGSYQVAVFCLALFDRQLCPLSGLEDLPVGLRSRVPVSPVLSLSVLTRCGAFIPRSSLRTECPLLLPAMLARALLHTSLVLWMTGLSLQGGVRPQVSALGRLGIPVKDASFAMGGAKPASYSALGALGARGYGAKLGKVAGRYPGAHLGGVGYRGPGTGRAALKQGAGYGAYGAYGVGLGNGMGLGLPHAGKRGVYGNGYATQPGYGAGAGVAYAGVRPGLGEHYFPGQSAKGPKPGYGAGNYPGGALGAGGYGTGLGHGGYPLAAGAGKLGGAANLGHGGYPQGGVGKPTEFGDGTGAYGAGGLGAGNGYGYGNGYNMGGNGYGPGYWSSSLTSSDREQGSLFAPGCVDSRLTCDGFRLPKCNTYP